MQYQEGALRICTHLWKEELTDPQGPSSCPTLRVLSPISMWLWLRKQAVPVYSTSSPLNTVKDRVGIIF